LGLFEICLPKAFFEIFPELLSLNYPLCGGGDTQSPQHSFQAGK